MLSLGINRDYIWRTFLLGNVIITSVTAPSPLPTPPAGYRYCNNDFSTGGPCMEIPTTTNTWKAARNYCRSNFPHRGELVTIRNQAIQDWVAGVLQNKGWSYAWFNGCIKLYKNKRFWFWQKRSGVDRLSYQGCYEDDRDYPDLPIQIPIPSGVSGPTECINMCDQDVASVQLGTPGLICRCGDDYGKHGRSHDAQCNDPCVPSGTGIDKWCGGAERQLIYTKGGQPFHAFAYIGNRDYEHCVVMNRGYDYHWTEQDCHEKFYYICWHESHNPDACTSPKHFVWGHCISVHNQLRTFYQATVDCYNMNADLVFITSEGMFNELVSNPNILDSTKSYWIGLTDEEWVDANYDPILSYFNWDSSQPNDIKDNDCLKMQGSSSKWYNSKCDHSLYFMCIVDVPNSPGPTPAPATPAPATPAPATPAPPPPPPPPPPQPAPTPAPPTTTTTTQSQPTQKTIGGVSQDLIIGLGAGAGGALVITLVACLCLCFWRRQAKEKSRRRKSKDQARSRSRSRDLPEIPEEQLAGAEYYTKSNRGYVPDLIHEHPRGTQAYSSHSSRSGASYADIGPTGYEDLERGSVSSHTYNKLNHDYHKYEYIDMPGSQKYASNRSGHKADKGRYPPGKSGKPPSKSGHSSNRSRGPSDRSEHESTRSGYETSRSGRSDKSYASSKSGSSPSKRR